MKTIRRRRQEGKTDYKARLALLKSEKPRLVVRKTNRAIIAQIVETDGAQDKIIVGITSHSLLTHGWPKELQGSLKSLPAAYLTGLLLANMVKSKAKEAVLDIGMNRNVHKSRLYAVLQGAVDGGLNVPHDPAALPSHEMLKGNAKLSKVFESVKHSLHPKEKK
ncbi:50S ribosomal protein L18 [Candidatus Pacearchaeota archaeon]|nr:50S ribosomal protein L18 [Candidatus Pacearchaeota archaeon]